MKLTRARQFSHDSPTDIYIRTNMDEQFIDRMKHTRIFLIPFVMFCDNHWQ